MKLSRCFLFVLLPALSACGVLGGGAGTLSEKCYTDPQPTPSAQLALGGLQKAGTDASTKSYVPGRLLVSYRSSAARSSPKHSLKQADNGASLAVQELEVTAQSVRQRFDLRSLGTLGSASGAEIVRTPPGTDVKQLATELRQDPRVAYAEPDYYLYPLGSPSSLPTISAAAAGVLPDDPLVPEQWHLTKFGLPEAWRLETGKSSIVLAVLDSGVDLSHEDLQGRARPPVATSITKIMTRTPAYPRGSAPTSSTVLTLQVSRWLTAITAEVSPGSPIPALDFCRSRCLTITAATRKKPR